MSAQTTDFRLDGRGPLYRQIKRAIADPILSGTVAPGTRLPSEEAFTRIFDTSRMTVNRALQMLADVGLVTRHRRNGTFVATRIAEHSVMDLRDIVDEVAGTGARHAYKLLARRMIAAPQNIAGHLGGHPGGWAGGSVVYVRCLHFGDDVPFVIEDRYINIRSVPDAVAEPFSETPPGRWLLENVPWSRAEHAITAITPSDDIARLLNIPANEACLRVERTTWLADQPVTCVHLTYPGTCHRLVGRFAPGG